MRYLLRSVDVSKTLMRCCYKLVNGIAFDERTLFREAKRVLEI